MNLLEKFFPFLQWLPKYRKEWLKGDINAGIIVAIMLIPQGMAYAMLAGLDPIHGLYAVTFPLIVYALLGTSRQLAVGPVAMVSLLTAAGISALQPESAAQYLIYSLTLAFLVGMIQFLMGIFKLGFIVNFLSHPVISGFTSAAAIIIGLSQIKHLLRIPLPNTEHAHEIIVAIFSQLGEIHLYSLLIGMGGILIIKFGKKIHKFFPSPLVAVIFGIAAVSFGNLESQGIKIVGEVPSGLPSFSLPIIDAQIWKQLLPVAFAISMIGFAESFAVAKTIQNKHKDYKLDANQELLGLGLANVIASVFKGMPITGGFSRTAVNDSSGAKTGLASIISAVLVFATLLFFTHWFHNLPNAILASVVIVAVSGLVNVSEPLHLWKEDRMDFFMLALTFFATLFLGIEIGIVSGMLVSLGVMIYRASKPHMALLGKVPNASFYRNIDRFPDLEIRKDTLIIRIDGPLYFANIEYIKSKLDAYQEQAGDEIKAIVINMEAIPAIDSTALQALLDWVKEWKINGLLVYFTDIKGPLRDYFKKSGFVNKVGEQSLQLSIEEALKCLDGKKAVDGFEQYTFQSNKT
jgi:sulfate permease, SulP family